MVQKKSYHVIPHPKGGWAVVKGGSGRASKCFDSQAEAIAWGRRVSRSQRSEFFIHKRDGTVRHKDPRPA
ncbi:MAG TPA: DUF2188 domain-containing protein [Thermoanaerobaculia bacterium]|nr:DUF2188 domain-containing protein [Thermoanaerobaculia bacterium]